MKTIRYISAASLAVGLTVGTGLLAGAAGAQPVPVTVNHGHYTVTIVASGLNTPRGILLDRRHHRVLVAEAGIASQDTAPCAPADGGVPFCAGSSGSIFSYSLRTGARNRIVTGLASEATQDGTAVLGVHDLTLAGHGRLNLVYGMNGDLTFHNALGPKGRDLGHTAILGRHGHVRLVGNLVRFEQIHNPETESVDSDPYGILTGRNGSTIVADAGGNDILRVTRNGHVRLLAVLPERTIQKNAIEGVPTSVVRGPDGALYYGQLTGYPYPKGAARVYRLVPGHKPTIFARGFTNIIDIAFDPSGRLIVLEIAKNNLLDPDQAGALIRVGHNGHKTLLASNGLTNPGGVAVVNNHVFYVTNLTTGVGGTGQLLRITTRG